MSSHQSNAMMQEIAPKGGYNMFSTTRIFGRRFSRRFWYSLGFIYFIGLATDLKRFERRKFLLSSSRLEMDEGRICIEPVLWSEIDRLTLTHLRKSRDEENEALKDAPGWVTGTWYGEPIYKTRRFFPHFGPENEVPHCGSSEAYTYAKDYSLHS